MPGRDGEQQPIDRVVRSCDRGQREETLERVAERAAQIADESPVLDSAGEHGIGIIPVRSEASDDRAHRRVGD